MAKITGLQGKAVGKVGGIVYAVSGGQMIAREYQPHIANPSTIAQVDQRAKLKLMSQVAAALAPVIVIPKEGLKSSRNLFIKKNFGSVSAQSGIAQLTYENLQLTNGRAGLPAIVASRDVTTGVSVELSLRADAAVSRVVYIAYSKTEEQTLQYVGSTIVEAAGAEGKFKGSLPYVEGDCVLFAYGMKDLSASATARYGDYNVQNGEDIARLAMTRNINAQDFQFTMTRGTTLFNGESQTADVGASQGRVYVTASGPGTVSGAGVFNLGETVTVVATPSANASFVGWRANGSSTIISTERSYSFVLNGLTDLVAVFEASATDSEYEISVSSNDATLGTVTPNGTQTITAGSSITLRAQPIGSNAFKGWFKNNAGVALNTSSTYTFWPTESMVIVGRFGTSDEFNS